jgi:hypothetical protein
VKNIEQYNTKKFTNSKSVIRSRNFKDKQYNFQKKMDKETNNDPQNPMQKKKGWAPRTFLKTRKNSGAPEEESVLVSLVYAHCITLVKKIGDALWMTKGQNCDYDKRTELWLRQMEHIHIWRRHSRTLYHVIVSTIKFSKWWFQLNR